ncbi:hypothetical protein [Paenibacillus luteus]|uniref:CDI toxin immunity protein n=1 Tax=Paenibacillus luteus TaxID=2545753 RepID=UPI0011420BF1|nr:hypothetical protein [Paenibacillus luteus]
MDEVKERKWRLEQLLNKQKKKEVVGFGVLFDECIEGLGTGTVILSEDKSKEMYQFIEKTYPFTSWARIDWEKIEAKIKIENIIEIIPQINQVLGEGDEEVFVLWSTGSQPVLKSHLRIVLDAIDEVLAVGADTFVFSPFRFVIEFHHEGEVILGFENQTLS